MKYNSVHFTFAMKGQQYMHTFTVTGAEMVVVKLQRPVLTNGLPDLALWWASQA